MEEEKIVGFALEYGFKTWLEVHPFSNFTECVAEARKAVSIAQGLKVSKKERQ